MDFGRGGKVVKACVQRLKLTKLSLVKQHREMLCAEVLSFMPLLVKCSVWVSRLIGEKLKKGVGVCMYKLVQRLVSVGKIAARLNMPMRCTTLAQKKFQGLRNNGLSKADDEIRI